jgi:hypothetical protein
VGWWVDHRRQAMKLRSDAWTIAAWKQISDFHSHEIANLKQELKAASASVPKSSAPALNPPKP